MHSVPVESGVYQILCVPTGKVYVGSAVNITRRWQDHRAALRTGNHENLYLQRAWNKYSEGAFAFSVLELVAVEGLLEAEQRWLDITRCYEEDKGFNICTVAGSHFGVRRRVDTIEKLRKANARTWHGFINPEGEPVIITNLYDFCRQHGLCMAGMRALHRGAKPQYRGWTCVENSFTPRPTRCKRWEGFISPDGALVEPIENLHKFCRERGLRYSDMHGLYTGKLRSAQGWRHVKTVHITSSRAYTGRRYERFISPSGDPVIIENLARFCRENGLNESRMRQVHAGTRKSHKGWTWRESR